MATLLKQIVPDVRKEAGAQHDYVSLGMLMDWKIQHGNRYSKVCLSTDGIGRRLFVLDGARSNIVVGARDVDDGRFGAWCADVVSAR